MFTLRAFVLSCWLLAALGCGGVTTETGNPSAIMRDLVSVTQVDGGLRVVGEPGAVMGDTVTLVNTTTGTRLTVTISGDGSFDVTIDGAAGDMIEIEVPGARVPLEGPVIIGDVTRTTSFDPP